MEETMTTKQDAQTGLWDREVEGVPELNDAIEAMLENEEAAKGYSKAKGQVKKFVETLELKDGERVRIGQYVITGRGRSGGWLRCSRMVGRHGWQHQAS
jgi:hypothetical protein